LVYPLFYIPRGSGEAFVLRIEEPVGLFRQPEKGFLRQRLRLFIPPFLVVVQGCSKLCIHCRIGENNAFVWAEQLEGEEVASLYTFSVELKPPPILTGWNLGQPDRGVRRGSGDPPHLFCCRQVVLDGEFHQPHQIVNVEFAHQAGAVSVDGLGADIQQIGDLLGS